MHRKSFAKTHSTNIVESVGHSWNPALFVDISWKGGPVGKLIETKSEKPSQIFVKPSQIFVEGFFGRGER